MAISQATQDRLGSVLGKFVERLVFEAPYVGGMVDLSGAFPILYFSDGSSLAIRLAENEEEFIAVDAPILVVPETLKDWSRLRPDGWSDRFELIDSIFVRALREKPITVAGACRDKDGYVQSITIQNALVGICIRFSEDGHTLLFDELSQLS